MSKILISYRREDSHDVTGRIYDRLVQQFGREAVFKDVDSIPLGVDFRAYLEEQVARCEVFLVVIGRNWMKAGRRGKSRLEDPEDFVRIEIEAALRRQIPVIPVLVGGTKALSAEQLPTSIRALAYRHALTVHPDPDFHRDVDRLIASFAQQVRGQSEPQANPDTQATSIQKHNVRVDSTAPVDMVKVPKGPFLYGEKKTRVTIPHDYWIDKYPVTNQQYQTFVAVGGYETQQYWAADGWTWKLTNNITAPAYWKAEKWNKPDHPVVGVSYYEAEAYAAWAGKRLPTEQEWEKAARGEDGRQYPWGDKFDVDRCNCSDSGIEHTTPVTRYPNGVSLYSCYDMAGNVWEWCASWYEQEQNERVVRGGSWYNPQVYTLAIYIGGTVASMRGLSIGFPLARDVDE